MRNKTRSMIVLATSVGALAGCGGEIGAGDGESAFLGEAESEITTCFQLARSNGDVVQDAVIAYDPTDPSWASLNLGSLPLLQAGVIATQSRMGVIQFALPAIPAGATITSADLSLVKQGSLGPGPITVYEVAGGGWSESTVTYNNFGGLGAQVASFAPVSVPSGSAAVVDLQGTVAAWYAGTVPNNGVALSMSQARATFSSSEATATLQPTLTVCYDVVTCSDGIQNGSETGIDCGGTCAPCPLWPRVYGAVPSQGPYGTISNDIATTPSGDVVVVGCNGENGADFGGGPHTMVNTDNEVTAARYDASGAYVSLGAGFVIPGGYGGPNGPYSFNCGNGVSIDAAGTTNVLAHGNDPFNDATSVLRFDAAGNSLGSIPLPNFPWGADRGITTDSSNNIYIAGSIFGAGVRVEKLTSAGTSLWTSTITGSFYSTPQSRVHQDSVGNLYFAGHFNATLNAPGGPITATGGTCFGYSNCSDTFLMKFDSAGTPLWVRTIGSNGFNDVAREIAINAADEVWMTGVFGGTVTAGPFTLTSAGGKDAFLVRYDGAGNVLSAQSVGTAGDEEGSDVVVDALDQVHWTGLTNASGLDLGGGALSGTGAWLSVRSGTGAHMSSQVIPSSLATSAYWVYTDPTWATPRAALMPGGGTAVTYADSVTGRPAVTVIP